MLATILTILGLIIVFWVLGVELGLIELKNKESKKKSGSEEDKSKSASLKTALTTEQIERARRFNLRLESLGVELDEEEILENKERYDFFELYDINYVYHITSASNLPMILKYGLLPHGNRYVSTGIDNKDVNNRRSRKEPIYNKVIHDYVPFYFNPKNPMLFVNKYRQNDIVILAFSNKILLKEGMVFTSGNAAKENASFFNSLDDLREINWDCINAEYWNSFENGKSERMAEVLVPDKVKIDDLCHIICFDESKRAYVNRIAPGFKVIVDRNMYF